MRPTLATAARDQVEVARDLCYEQSADDERQGVYAALFNKALTYLNEIARLEAGLADFEEVKRSWDLDLKSWQTSRGGRAVTQRYVMTYGEMHGHKAPFIVWDQQDKKVMAGCGNKPDAIKAAQSLNGFTPIDGSEQTYGQQTVHSLQEQVRP